MPMPDLALPLTELRSAFGSRLQEQAPLSRYTSARLGGPANALLVVNTAEELAGTASRLWELGASFMVLGGGSNVLVSDRGVHEVVVLNRAREVHFEPDSNPPAVWAESGANLGSVARQAASRGLPGLEWAANIPGTVGGAVAGNAGAYGGDIASQLLVAEILHLEKSTNSIQREEWPADRLEYAYRTSRLKRNSGESVVLSARLRLEPAYEGSRKLVEAQVTAFTEHRRRTQPPGASMGSMFKNPPGDYAGRLIEAAGLKGASQGGAEISERHANFFVNRDQATAEDVYRLIEHARETVAAKFGVQLELEVELVGEWD